MEQQQGHFLYREELDRLVDFHQAQDHRGWLVFQHWVLQLREQKKQEIENAHTPEQAWEMLQQLHGIDEVIELQQMALTRREELKNDGAERAGSEGAGEPESIGGLKPSRWAGFGRW